MAFSKALRRRREAFVKALGAVGHQTATALQGRLHLLPWDGFLWHMMGIYHFNPVHGIYHQLDNHLIVDLFSLSMGYIYI